MKVIKKINTSAALALDSAGHEVVILGKGVGFPPVPYELEDLSRVERTFYDIDPKYLGMIRDLPKEILMVSADIAEQAELELDCQLNPNLPLTLADHLSFAIERMRKNFDLTAPIAYDIGHLYPGEYELGKQALQMLEEQTGICLPQNEAVSVALHLINAETENSDLHSFITMMNIMGEVDDLIEQSLNIRLDKDGYNYSRFVIALSYLIQRLETGTQVEHKVNSMKRTLMWEYPDIYQCACRVTAYFKESRGWNCSDDETVYLMLHIYRVKSRND